MFKLSAFFRSFREREINGRCSPLSANRLVSIVDYSNPAFPFAVEAEDYCLSEDTQYRIDNDEHPHVHKRRVYGHTRFGQLLLPVITTRTNIDPFVWNTLTVNIFYKIENINNPNWSLSIFSTKNENYALVVIYKKKSSDVDSKTTHFKRYSVIIIIIILWFLKFQTSNASKELWLTTFEISAFISCLAFKYKRWYIV